MPPDPSRAPSAIPFRARFRGPSRRRRRFPLRRPIRDVRRWAPAMLAVGAALVVVTAPDTGAEVEVVVARQPLAVGATLGPDDVARRPIPAGLAPAGPADPDAVTGRAVAAPMVEGEVVVEARLAPPGTTGLAAAVPSGHRAVAVPIPDGTPPLEPGQRIDVLAPDRTTELGSGTALAAAGATVLDLSDGTVTLLVGVEEATAVAGAVLDGAVVLALRGPQP